jgi:hypothetical protein
MIGRQRGRSQCRKNADFVDKVGGEIGLGPWERVGPGRALSRERRPLAHSPTLDATTRSRNACGSLVGWRPNDELGKLAQVLGGGGEQEFVSGAARPTQA